MAPPDTSPKQTRKTTRREWPEFTQGRAIGMHEAGLPFSEISKRVGIPRSTLATAWQRFVKTGTTSAPKRPGRPRKTSTRDERNLVIAARRNRDTSYSDLRMNFAVKLSSTTIRRRLAEHGVHKQSTAEPPKSIPDLGPRRPRHRNRRVEE